LVVGESGVAAGTARAESVEDGYRRLRPGMVRLAHLLLGSPEHAEDVVHDAFVACAPRWSSLEAPEAYVRTAVANHARSTLRRAGRDRDKADRLGRSVALSAGLPELDETWALLRRLPERQRLALVLRFYDLPEAEIARLVGCRPGTVKSLIHRGLARVRKDVLR
jgi:DNA-directed RNA polymerase specialized sigma24 family protein